MALLAAAAVALAIFARRRGLSPALAAGLGYFLVVWPTSASYAHFLWPEILHLALLGWALVLGEQATPWRAAATGLLLGLALLAKSLLTPLIPVLLLLVWASAPARRLLVAASFAAALALTLAPTLVENHRATGRWVVADSSTFNLWLGLNDTGRNGQRNSIAWREFQAWQASAPDAAGRDAILREKIDALVEERGWPRILDDQLGRQYFRLFDWRSNLVEQFPGGAFHELGQGFVAPTQPGTPADFGRKRLAALWRGGTWLGHFLLLLFAGAGLLAASWPRRADPFSWWPWLFLLFHLAAFALLHAKSRYLIQLLPTLLLMAGHAVSTRGQRPLWVPLLGAAALLLFGFGGSWLDHA